MAQRRTTWLQLVRPYCPHPQAGSSRVKETSGTQGTVETTTSGWPGTTNGHWADHKEHLSGSFQNAA